MVERSSDRQNTMCDLYPEIRKAIREIKDAEIDNFRRGIHRLRGKTDRKSFGVRSKCYDLRNNRLLELHELLDWALPAGIKAGFSGEHVQACLKALMESTEEAAYWEGSFEGSNDDDWAWAHHLDCLFDLVREKLGQLGIWSSAAAGLLP